jgi:hypothetical protein
MRVILADVSRSVGRIAEVRDSVRALYQTGDALVVFDSSARLVKGSARDSIDRLTRADQDGALSPALITALRTASDHRTRADSFELVIVTPLKSGLMDAATDAIRELWPGRARVVRVAARADTAFSASGFRVEGPPDDPVRLAASLTGAPPTETAVRIVRGAATAADSAWSALDGHTLVRWPASDAPPGWTPHTPADTVGAIVSDGIALVGAFERRWRLEAPAGAERVGVRVAARWVDGEPAAVEHRVAMGCIRDVAFPVPAQGDLVLRPSFARMLRTLARPCDASVGGAALTPSALAALAGAGRLAASAAIPRPDVVATPLVPWLLAAALFAALAELVVRRRTRVE